MLKKSCLSLGLALTVLVVTAQPSFAAPLPGFSAIQSGGNPIQKVLNSINNGVQRFYLKYIPGDKPGKVVLAQALQSTQKLKIAQMSSDLTAHFLNNGQEQGALHLNIKGPAQFSQESNHSINQDLHITGEFSLQGTSLKTAADVKTTAENTYFKLNQVPNLPGIDLSSITGKWYRSPNATGSAGVENQPELTEDQQKRLQMAFNKLISTANAGEAKSQIKADRSVFVVTVTLPRSAVADYISTVIQVQSENKKDQKVGISYALQEKSQQFVERSGDLSVTTWIDKSTFNILHAECPISYELLPEDKENFQKGPLSALSQVNTLKMDFKFDFSDFDSKIEFFEPTEAVDAQDILTATLGKILAPSSASSVGTSELPALTPYQQQQLQQMNSLSPEQRSRFLDQISKVRLSTGSATTPATP